MRTDGPASHGIPQQLWCGGIAGNGTESTCGGTGILYSSAAIAASTDPSAANTTTMWLMCGELQPGRALRACAAVPDCQYVARHETNDAVHIDPTLDANDCVNATTSAAACPDPKLPFLWFFFDGCVGCGGRDWITPADGLVSCSARDNCGGRTKCGNADGSSGNMLGSGAEFWMWSGSPTWRKRQGAGMKSDDEFAAFDTNVAAVERADSEFPDPWAVY